MQEKPMELNMNVQSRANPMEATMKAQGEDPRPGGGHDERARKAAAAIQWGWA